LPTGRLQPSTVLRIGVTTAVLGVASFAVAVNLLTAVLGAISVLVYLFLYTPLKRVTWLNTAVGTIPGGFPALMGWTAAHNRITWEGIALFGILAFWQLPHFMAIAWIYRDEYAKAGFKMLPVLDPEGRRTSHQALGNIIALCAVSVMPFVLNLAGPVYLCGAILLGAAFFWSAVRFAGGLTIARARQLFLMSIIYLPVLLVIMVLDKSR
jgi:protoheme IX farnesyltransferase